MKYLALSKTSSEKLTQSDNALAIYNRSVNTAPESPWGFLHRAIFHNNQDQFDLALKDFNQAIHLNHNYGLAYYHRGQFHQKQAESHQNSAMRDYDQALNINPRNVWAMFNRAILHARSSNFAQALDDLSQAIKLQPHETSLYTRGVVYHLQNQIQLAGEDYKNALAMNPKHYPSMINLALILYDHLEEIQPAIQLFEQAVSFSEEVEAKLALAVSDFRQNQIHQKSYKFEKKMLNIHYLKDNLWGPKLIKDTKTFLSLMDL
ncbi:MAG: tetratricopeptide repeat protein [Crocosphaera sp.]